MATLTNFDVSRLRPFKYVIQSVGGDKRVGYLNEASGFVVGDPSMATIYDEEPSPDLLAALAVRESSRGVQIVAVEVDVRIKLSKY